MYLQYLYALIFGARSVAIEIIKQLNLVPKHPLYGLLPLTRSLICNIVILARPEHE